MAGEVEVRSLLLKVDASVELLRKNLSDAGTQLDTFTKKGEGAATRFDASMKRVNASSGQMRAGFQQLSFQLSDVATQLGSGTSALQVFSQQGGQVVQAIGLMTGSTRGFLSVLGGPWGILLTSAVTLLLKFGQGSDDAADKQKHVAVEAGSAASITQSTLAGLRNAFDPFIQNANQAIAKLREFKIYLAQEVNSQTRSNLQFLDRASGAFNTVGRFLPGSLGTPLLLDTGRARRFDQGFQRDQAAQNRQRALDAQDQRFGDILGRLGFTRTTNIGGYVGDLSPAKVGGGGRTGGGRSRAAAIKEIQDPLADLNKELAQAVAYLDRMEVVDPDKAASAAARKFYGNLGVDTNELGNIVKGIDERKNAEFQANLQIAQDELQKRTDNIRTLSGLYVDLFQGGTKAIFRDFKQIGLQVIAELLARFTLSQFGGSKTPFDFGGALSQVLAGALPGFANGGNPPVGRASIVGERGPELFIPKVPGTIIPNGRGVGGNSVSLTINAPGATAETVAMIRRELANAAPAIIQASQKTTVSALQRPRL